MKITKDVQKLAAEEKISEEQLQVDLEQTTSEFTKVGADFYAKQ
jgi:hypothetical protein